MGESVKNQSETTKKSKKTKKRKLEDKSQDIQTTETSEPPPKLGKPHKHVKKSRKKVKKEEKQQKEREIIFDKYKSHAVVYLQTWKIDKSTWKFNKMTQNWIVAHLYDPLLLPEEVWPIVLEYFAGSRGAAKENLIKTATSIIEDQQDTPNEQEAIKQSRAKDIIQFIE